MGVAERSPIRCGPAWRAIHYAFDAARMFEQLQRYFTLRGADAITDHGAENVDIAQRTSMETFPRPLVSDCSFLFFSIAPQSHAPEKEEEREKEEILFFSRACA